MLSNKISSKVTKLNSLICNKLSRTNNNINSNIISRLPTTASLIKYHNSNTFSTNTNNNEIPRFVKIVEVGPRDGLQNEKKIVPTSDKIKFITKLAQSGIPTIEITSFVSSKWIPQLSDAEIVVETIKSNIDDPFKKDDNYHSDNINDDDDFGIGTRMRKTTFNVLVPNLYGTKAAIKCGTDEISIFTSASETFSKKNINCTINESFDRFEDVALLAKEYNIPIRGYISCTLGCPYEGDNINVCDVGFVAERLLELGCYEISLADTIGVGTPNKVIDLLDEVQKIVPTDRIAVHFHDTYGQALANIYAALTKGISTIDSSVSGLGGCPYAIGASGNVATEDVVYMLNGMDIRTGIDLNKLIHAGEFICNVLQCETRSNVAKALLQKEINERCRCYNT